jgi:hypothetical protein
MARPNYARPAFSPATEVPMFERLLNRFFDREEMDGNGRCATYLVRWTLLKLPGQRGIYLHHFVGDDWCLDLHDHPKRFISIGLWGRYVEETPEAGYSYLYGALRAQRVYRAPWIRTFPAHHVHRISLIDGRPCWTLVVVLKTVRPWGFWHGGRWVPWRTYVGSPTATRMKSCPD